MKLNKSGNRRGMHGNQRIPKNHPWRIASFGNLERSVESGFKPEREWREYQDKLKAHEKTTT